LLDLRFSGKKTVNDMSEETKNEILKAWSRHLVARGRQAVRNEGSSAQVEDYRKVFKHGVMKHAKLSQKEKNELLAHMGFAPPAA
jgi:hypothetical protein